MTYYTITATTGDKINTNDNSMIETERGFLYPQEMTDDDIVLVDGGFFRIQSITKG